MCCITDIRSIYHHCEIHSTFFSLLFCRPISWLRSDAFKLPSSFFLDAQKTSMHSCIAFIAVIRQQFGVALKRINPSQLLYISKKFTASIHLSSRIEEKDDRIKWRTAQLTHWFWVTTCAAPPLHCNPRNVKSDMWMLVGAHGTGHSLSEMGMHCRTAQRCICTRGIRQQWQAERAKIKRISCD